ncbi:hypothetical protein MASR1M36_09070 [Candidatus Cloacimonadaceae bacterium]
MIDLLRLMIPTDLVQGIFWFTMLTLSVASIVFLKLYAKASSWEKIWKNNTEDTDDDDVDVEHGSVIELCEVVTTKSETFAEYLPGILLTMGLLGTFIGLAQSIGHAAQTIALSADQISTAGSSTSSLEEAMVGMLSLMQGMGTQFKTSIWGIIGFLTLKIINNRIDFERNRIKWTICKMNTERRKKERNILNKQTRAFEKTLTEKLCIPISNLLEATIYKLDKVVCISEQTRKNTGTFCHAIESFTTTSSETLRTFGVASTALSSSVGDLKQGVTDLLKSVTNDLSNVIETMKNDINTTMENLNKNVDSMAGSVTDFKNGMEGALKKFNDEMGKVLTVQNDAFATFKTSTDTTLKNIEKLGNDMKALVDKLDLNLQAVSNSNQQLSLAVGLFNDGFNKYNNINGKLEVVMNSLSSLISSAQNLMPRVSDDAEQQLESVTTTRGDAIETSE